MTMMTTAMKTSQIIQWLNVGRKISLRSFADSITEESWQDI
jgi:hypothetical protein